MEISKEILYYGRPEPLAQQIPLKAGPLSLVFQAGDLRYIRLGSVEIIRRIYVAVRDHNWGTIPPRLAGQHIDERKDSFEITYEVTHQYQDIDFCWQGTIAGEADGTIIFHMCGEARSTFRRNRIGFCVLHPMDCAGALVKIEHCDGSVELSQFPRSIAPQLVRDGHPCPVAPFEHMRALAHQVHPGLWAEVRLEGDDFEMEDQRNWTDASFKTYCTPLSLPFPVEIQAGTKINQSVRVSLHKIPPHSENFTQEQDVIASLSRSLPRARRIEVISTKPKDQQTIQLNITGDPLPLPKIGLGIASHGQPLSPKEIERLKQLNLSHLRVDLYLSNSHYPQKLQQASNEARSIGTALEIALFLTDAARQELASFVKILHEVQPPVLHWLVFHAKEKTTPAWLISLARQYLSTYNSLAKIVSGTNAYFTEVNAHRPTVDELDGLVYSINPQVHANDNLSLVEALAAQAETVTSARLLGGGKSILVSPVTLKPRFNPSATQPEARLATENLPAQVDERQSSLFGLCWTLGSLKYLAESGAYSTTYFETTGWLGIMEQERGSPLPEKFWSIPGGVYPLFHLFADVAEMGKCRVIPLKSSQPLLLDGLLLENDDQRMLLLANFTTQLQTVKLPDLPPVLQIRRINTSNLLQAMGTPESFRQKSCRTLDSQRKAIQFKIQPFETLRLVYPLMEKFPACKAGITP